MSIESLTTEKFNQTLFKYWLHPETIYIKAKDANDNVIIDKSIEVDLFKIDKLVKDLHRLSEAYGYEIFIRYKGFSKDDVLITFKHSL